MNDGIEILQASLKDIVSSDMAVKKDFGSNEICNSQARSSVLMERNHECARYLKSICTATVAIVPHSITDKFSKTRFTLYNLTKQ